MTNRPQSPQALAEYRAILLGLLDVALDRYGSAATAEEIVQVIFEEDSTRHPSEYFVDLIERLGVSEAEVDAVLPLIQNAWNYFPHRSLGGRCPAEVMTEPTPSTKRRSSKQSKQRRA